jgi:hypothetical protein
MKRFAKEYRGKRWEVTLKSIEQDLRRVHAMQSSQQVDELKHGSGCILFKYDFTIAQSGESTRASGNRCVIFLDVETHQQTILLCYGKGDLPKNMHETQFIYNTVEEQFKDLWQRLD